MLRLDIVDPTVPSARTSITVVKFFYGSTAMVLTTIQDSTSSTPYTRMQVSVTSTNSRSSKSFRRWCWRCWW